MSIDSPLLQLPNVYRAFYGGFTQLTAIQADSLQPILSGQDVILQAATGTGKTEAVLAPCLERLLQSQPRFSLIYIVPTRALATDLKRRLQPIAARLEITLGLRTGDHKHGGQFPDVILTTPESLDVLLGSRNPALQQFLARLAIVVIDEVHTLLHQYRGQQLAYCMQRLARRAGSARSIQKIALSATLAQPAQIAAFFRFADGYRVITQAVHRAIVPQLIQLKRPEIEWVALTNDLYERFGYRKILLFANSRRACDELFGRLNASGRFQGCCGLHYSNLQPKARQQVEQQFRQQRQALCISTSTLELGIDIGDVDSVILFEPPDSAAAFLQRIGRANRRQTQTVFWGICQGKQADTQLLRFMALLRLARQGQIEVAPAREFPSVLIQQTASCLYEKQRLSLAAMHDLLPQHPAALSCLWPHLQQHGWLKPTAIPHLFGGGWRYYEALKKQRIWHNFPPTEEDYDLQWEQQTLAQLPKSIANQLKVGDTVQLVGKSLHITEINHSPENRQILAKTTAQPPEKELFWLGAGFRLSYEVAQQVQQLLAENPAGQPFNPEEFGLFSRTQALAQQFQLNQQASVTLANGIQVRRLANGHYGYFTFIGALGDAILKWLIEAAPADEPPIAVSLQDFGFECNTWLDFQALPYPLTDAEFRQFVQDHLRPLSLLFSLNAFCRYLPEALLIEEITHCLYDSRLLTHFRHYQQQSNAIVRGDATTLVWEPTAAVAKSLPVLLTASTANALLLEQQRYQQPLTSWAWPPACPAKPLTARAIGHYFYHQQCPRWLHYQGLSAEARPPRFFQTDELLQPLRREAERHFEQQVLAQLAQTHTLQDCSESGLILPLTPPLRPLLLLHCRLTGSAGSGIPDLIRVEYRDDQCWLSVGDIKTRHQPHYSQKWPVAYCVALLQQQLPQLNPTLPTAIAPESFIITPTLMEEGGIQWHFFDHQPYLHALPALWAQLNAEWDSPAEPSYHLQPHCTQCDFFTPCYQQSLTEDIQYLPQLTPGLRSKLASLSLKTLAELTHYCQQTPQSPLFSAAQITPLQAQLQALNHNQITLKQTTTRAYPANLTRTLLLFIQPHPLTGQPHHLALQLRDSTPQPFTSAYWLNLSATTWETAWEAFQQQLIQHWQDALNTGQVPHLLDWEGNDWQYLQQWGQGEVAALWQDTVSHHSALASLLMQQCYLPLAGRLTRYQLNHWFNAVESLPQPASLWHPDPLAEVLTENEINQRFTLQAQVWQWLQQQCVSAWHYQPSTSARYLDFIEAEKYHRETQILTLQQYPLAERVARFRAIGPLRFSRSELDHEGQWRYQFVQVDWTPATPRAKFRAGDFLKLAPLGTPDLQAGFAVILSEQVAETLWLQVRGRRLICDKNRLYSLEEDLSDWTTPKLMQALQSVVSHPKHPLTQLLHGQWPIATANSVAWLQRWLQQNPQHGLNAHQQQALQLPFQYRLGLIEGPPGTGKTHLLAWTLLALISQAQAQQRPLRIAVTALTHQAIDQILSKVAQILSQHPLLGWAGQCYKFGREAVLDAAESDWINAAPDWKTVQAIPHLLLGATGFGLYQLLDSKQGAFRPEFDWIIVDEASQLLIPQALLALLYGKGQFLLYGDDRQLPPIVLGHYPPQQWLQNSILTQLLQPAYAACRVRLNQSYRMNQTLCQFPSTTWYDGELQPAAGNQHRQLVLPDFPPVPTTLLDTILNPAQAVSLVLLPHHDCDQHSPAEAAMASQLAQRLIEHYHLSAEEIALISPHRAHNNWVQEQLQNLLPNQPLPWIDTIERVQGAEREVIVLSLVTSNPDYFTEFLNNPRRFNVAITRARSKLIVVGSGRFFALLADEETVLISNQCFKQFLAYCEQQNSVFRVMV